MVCGKVRRSKAPTCRTCYMAARAATYIDLECAQCGGSFRVMRAERDKRERAGRPLQRFCSLKCSGKASRTLGRVCVHCGERTGSKDPRKRYCSEACNIAARMARLPRRTCPHCGQVFTANGARVKYCGRACASAAHSVRMIGNGNSHFKDGTSYALWFRSIRPLILERDGRKCMVCSLPERGLLVHHIDHRPERNEPENLITLCRACHAVHHKSAQTPFPWFADYAVNATRSMTLTWKATTTSLRDKFSSTTA